MAKSTRILSFFPSIYGIRNPGKLLRYVVGALTAPLEEADSLLFRIQRAHRINVAEQAEDILHLASILNLTPFHFEDVLQNDALSYRVKLDICRDRVKRIAQQHLEGLGTPRAVLQCASIFLNATIVPESAGDPLIKHEDADRYSHKAVLQFDFVKDKPHEPIYLHEGLLRRQKVDSLPRYALNSWDVHNDGAEQAPIRIAIQGVGDRTVLPSVFCADTQRGVTFNGIVPDSKTLIIDSTEGATLDGSPVDDWMTYFEGGIVDFGFYGGAEYSVGHESTAFPFDGDLSNLSPPSYQALRPVPQARAGSSTWYFNIARGVYDGCRWDFAVCDVPQMPIGTCDGDFQYDACVYDFEPSGEVGMAWDQRVTCAFKLLLPQKIPQAGSQKIDYVGRISSILPRFKAAGVKAYVDYAPDAWVLGESILRDPGASSGEGIEFHSTIVRTSEAELFVA
jgi:hypothetical protein